MSFLTTVPEELLAAAAQLGAITSSLTAQNAGAAAATTIIAPAASDSVSIQQAGIFSAFGTQYQTIAAEAQTIQEQFASTLGTSSGTYSATESANAAQATANAVGGGNIIDIISGLLGGPSGSLNGNPFSLSSNFANYLNIGGGNWASAGSDLLGLAGGGLLDTSGGSAAAAADLAGSTAPATVPVGAGAGMAGMGMMPMAAGAGQASMVGKLSVPPSWAGTVASATSSATAVETVGLTTAMPQAGAGAIVPGMPGMASAARNSAGFGAPRYGVKPIVMPKPTAV
jgi:hypothetical protein